MLQERFLIALFIHCWLTTAASFFWLPTTETYPFGTTSILISLIVVIIPLLSSNIIAHAIAFVFASAITVTNGMIAIVAQFAKLRWRKLIIALVSGIILLLSVNLIQHSQFPKSGMLKPKRPKRDFNAFVIRNRNLTTYLEDFILTPLTPAQLYYTFIPKFHTGIKGIKRWPPTSRPIVLTRPLMPKLRYKIIYKNPRILYSILCSIWILLLLGGILSSLICWRNRSLLPIVLASVLGQFILHLIYGPETFIYSLHWMPLMVIISAANSCHKWRYPALVFAIVLFVGCAFCNFNAFSASREIISIVDLDALN